MEPTPSRSTKIAESLLNLMLALLLIGAAFELVSTSVGLARGGNTLHGRTLPVHANLATAGRFRLPPASAKQESDRD